MNTVIYYDQYTAACAQDLAGAVAVQLGIEPRMMEVGRDITTAELESVLIVDMRRQSYPLLTDASTDEIITDLG